MLIQRLFLENYESNINSIDNPLITLLNSGLGDFFLCIRKVVAFHSHQVETGPYSVLNITISLTKGGFENCTQEGNKPSW